MSLWLVRAGRYGEHLQRFLDNNRVFATWDELAHDLSTLTDRSALRTLLEITYPDASKGQISNYTGQLWAFTKKIKIGDWVIVPHKGKSSVNIAEVAGPYQYDENAEPPYYHYHDVKWIAHDIPRSNFDQDLLYSLGAIGTICQIERNDAEKRVRAMGGAGWKSKVSAPAVKLADSGTGEEAIDLELLARDQIAKLIIQKLKGHGLARLVDAILQAQGYTTFLSPEGPDKGIDILAAPGPLGFGSPRLCVQVKSGDSPVDLPTLNQLIGSMQNVHAEQGLLVSWGGFKQSVDREVPSQFFRVRLWDQDDIIGELLNSYDRIDESLRAELPLKRMWTVAFPDESD